MSADNPLPSPPPPAPSSTHGGGGSALAMAIISLLAVGALALSALLWQRLASIQEQLARQSAETGAQAIEARTVAREAQDLARDSSAKLTVLETRVGEVALQRSQLEELMQSLSRSRDENLVVDIEAGIRLAQQQAQLTGSLQPLLAALHSASQRIERASQPRLTPVLRAMAQDTERLERANVTDTAGLLGRLDDLVRQVGDLPLRNAATTAQALHGPAARPGGEAADEAPAQDKPADAAATPPWQAWLQRAWTGVRDEALTLVRIQRIEHPDAVLLAPEQAFFLRENLKMQLLNARLSLLGRRTGAARADLAYAYSVMVKYFDPTSRRTQNALQALQQLQEHMTASDTPTLDDTFAALATAAAGR
ncbi:hypothetical protein GCM10022279_15000 [Comamonas faecalis]|uniref:Uroporphyrin-3 C-methyltransferase n=1 Tax=Comamonas faecalis TaxID=1387849 RepID=A0ABP7R5J8_9BURK